MKAGFERKSNKPTLLIKENKQKNGLKPIFVVSKKTAHKAVDRNKIKRLLREVIRNIEKERGIPITDITIRCFPAVRELTFKQMKGEVSTLLQ